jgi:outer membrane protein TolC
MMKYARTFSLILATLSPWAAGTARAALTADDAVKMALAKNSQIIGANANVLDARSGLYGAYSGILPRITADFSRSVSAQTQRRGTQAFSGVIFPTDRQDFEQYTNSPTLSGSWTFLDLSALSGYQAARGGLRAAEQAHKATRQEVALDTRQKYYEVVKAIHLSRVSTDALRLSRDDERRVRALFNVGSVSRSDLLKARVRTAQSELDSILKHNASSVSRIVLATTLGIEEPAMGELDTTLTAEPRALDEAQVLAEAEQARPDLIAAKLEWDAAKASVRAANFLRLPSLYMSGSATFRPVSRSKTTLYDTSGVEVLPPVEFNTRSDVDAVYNAQIGLTWNLFTGFSTEGQIASSKARLMRAKETYEVLRRNLSSEVRQTLLTYREVVEASNVASRALESAEENLKLTQQKYNVGSSTILDLIDAQVQLQRARSDIVSALAGIRVADARVERVRGKGD